MIFYQLGHILVTCRNDDIKSFFAGDGDKGSYDIVCLDTLDRQTRPAEHSDQFMDGCGLFDQIVWHGRTVCLVFLIKIITESLAFRVEYTGNVGCGIILLQTVQHIQKTIDGSSRFAFGIAQIRQGMISAIKVTGSID